MCLTRPCLTIYEVGAIVTVEYVHDKRQCSLLKHLKLGALRLEDGPENEIFLGLFRSHVESEHLWLVWGETDAA